MSSVLQRLVVIAFVVAAIGFSAPIGASDKAVFIEMQPRVLADVVSSSGVVVGNLRTGGAFHWMPTSGDVFIGGTSATAISRDGRVIAGAARDPNGNEQAAIWQRGSEWRLLGSIVPNPQSCDHFLSNVNGGNADGTVLVGLAWNGCAIAHAFRWTEETGMVDLGSTVASQASRADGVSGDGRVVVGWQENRTGFRQGARWIDGQQTVFTGPDGVVGEANGANTDGSIVVGQACRPGIPFDQSAWVWTSREGTQCLEAPRARLGAFIGIAAATSEDGRIIGGSQSFGLDAESVIWIDRTPYYLKDYLRSHGAPRAFDGWENTGFVTGMTRDGRVLVGYGAGPRDFTGFMVVMPALGEQR